MSRVFSDDRLPYCELLVRLAPSDIIKIRDLNPTIDINGRITDGGFLDPYSNKLIHGFVIRPYDNVDWTRKELVDVINTIDQTMDKVGVAKKSIKLKVHDENNLESLLSKVELLGKNRYNSDHFVLEKIDGVAFEDSFYDPPLDKGQLMTKIKRVKYDAKVKKLSEEEPKDRHLEFGYLKQILGGIEVALKETDLLMAKLMIDNGLNPVISNIDGSVKYDDTEVKQKSSELFNELESMKNFRLKLQNNADYLSGVIKNVRGNITIALEHAIPKMEQAIASTKKETENLPASTWTKRFDNILIKLFNMLNTIGSALGMISGLKLHKAEAHQHIIKMEQDISKLHEPLTLYKDLQQQKRIATGEAEEDRDKSHTPSQSKEKGDKNDKRRP